MAKFLSFQDPTVQNMFPPWEKGGTEHKLLWPWKKWFAKDDSGFDCTHQPKETAQDSPARRLSKKVIPSLPRQGTFKRQQSELRDKLEPVIPKAHERRALSVDPRSDDKPRRSTSSLSRAIPRASAPQFGALIDATHPIHESCDAPPKYQATPPTLSKPSPPPSLHDRVDNAVLEEELERTWILNLSMHFRDRSNREKFFVTYAETPYRWRRVTISLDYRNAQPNSLEEELQGLQYQRDKSARIYDAIRDSLQDIQFYDTVTNLKLKTEDDRLHVHVTEDVHEVIHFPPVWAIDHLQCRKYREEEIQFAAHLSGFVYKVRVKDEVFIKKEIPGPETVDEFLYEINALQRLSGSTSVIQFGGVITDNTGQHLKGLLISFAEKGALIDVIYDGKGRLPWKRRERWAKQIVQGLSEIHEAGFVQGDFTLSNIVIDGDDKAKIIDINRRGCPVGWEPPEIAALLESRQRTSMYIGVKSDIFQLGMVLWALAMEEDEPEIQPRPLAMAAASSEVPSYYRALVGICLSDDPRRRCHTTSLLSMFPDSMDDEGGQQDCPRPLSGHLESHYFDPANAVERADIDDFRRQIFQAPRAPDPAISSGTYTYVNPPTDISGDPYYYLTRGRSRTRSLAQSSISLDDDPLSLDNPARGAHDTADHEHGGLAQIDLLFETTNDALASHETSWESIISGDGTPQPKWHVINQTPTADSEESLRTATEANERAAETAQPQSDILGMPTAGGNAKEGNEGSPANVQGANSLPASLRQSFQQDIEENSREEAGRSVIEAAEEPMERDSGDSNKDNMDESVAIGFGQSAEDAMAMPKQAAEDSEQAAEPGITESAETREGESIEEADSIIRPVASEAPEQAGESVIGAGKKVGPEDTEVLSEERVTEEQLESTESPEEDIARTKAEELSSKTGELEGVENKTQGESTDTNLDKPPGNDLIELDGLEVAWLPVETDVTESPLMVVQNESLMQAAGRVLAHEYAEDSPAGSGSVMRWNGLGDILADELPPTVSVASREEQGSLGVECTEGSERQNLGDASAVELPAGAELAITDERRRPTNTAADEEHGLLITPEEMAASPRPLLCEALPFYSPCNLSDSASGYFSARDQEQSLDEMFPYQSGNEEDGHSRSLVERGGHSTQSIFDLPHTPHVLEC